MMMMIIIIIISIIVPLALWSRPRRQSRHEHSQCPYSTANLRTNIMDFRGFESSIIIILRGGILRPTGDFPESLGQAILVEIMLVGRL